MYTTHDVHYGKHAIVPVWKPIESQSSSVYDEEKGIWTGMVGKVSKII